MMKNVRKWHVLATALVVAVFLLPACSGKSDKKDDDKKETNKKEADKKHDDPVGDAKPDFSLTATQFAAEYKKDRNAADARYGDKVIELTGIVIEVGYYRSSN